MKKSNIYKLPKTKLLNLCKEFFGERSIAFFKKESKESILYNLERVAESNFRRIDTL